MWNIISPQIKILMLNYSDSGQSHAQSSHCIEWLVAYCLACLENFRIPQNLKSFPMLQNLGKLPILQISQEE